METLSGILANAMAAVNRGPAERDQGIVGQVFAVINVEAFRSLDDFTADVDRTLDAIHALKPSEGFDQVLAPGEPEFLKKSESVAHGIGYPAGLLEAVATTAKDYGVDPVWDT